MLTFSAVPDPPINVQATEVTDCSVTLAWQPPKSDGGSPITGYIIERKQPTGNKWIRVNKVAVKELEYTIKDLLENDVFEFRVSAENLAGIGKPSKPTQQIVIKFPFGKYNKLSLYFL